MPLNIHLKLDFQPWIHVVQLGNKGLSEPQKYSNIDGNFISSLISFLLSLHSAFLSLNPGLEHIILFSCFVASQHLLVNQKDLIFQNIFMTAVITLLYTERNMLADIQQTFIEQLPWTGKMGQEEGYPPIPCFV